MNRRNQIIVETGKLIDAFHLTLAIHQGNEAEERKGYSLLGALETFCNDLTFAGKDMKYSVSGATKRIAELRRLVRKNETDAGSAPHTSVT